MRRVFLFWLLACSFVQGQTSICIGEQLSVSSKVLGETRTISVYLPDSYYDSTLKRQTILWCICLMQKQTSTILLL